MTSETSVRVRAQSQTHSALIDRLATRGPHTNLHLVPLHERTFKTLHFHTELQEMLFLIPPFMQKPFVPH